MGLRRALRAAGVAAAALGALAPSALAREVARCDGARVAGGVARSVTDCTPVDLSRGPETAARQAIDRVSGALKVDADELRLAQATPSAAGPRVRFQQYADGVPVLDGQVTVALGRDGAVQQILNGASSDGSVDASPRVGRAEALLTARRRVPSGFDLVAPPTTRLVADPRGGRLALAWLVVLPVRAPRGDWNVVVSARDGEVLDAYDSLKRADGTTLTYAPNPIQTTGDTSLRGDKSPQPPSTARVRVPLSNLGEASNRLIGTNVNTSAPDVIGCSPRYTPGQAASPTRTYEYPRTDIRFAETVAYAAIDRVVSAIPELGIRDPFSSPVQINVHCIGDDNSYYSPVDHGLHMGDGGIDDAEDADVIVHELGHAIQNAQVPGFGPGTKTEQAAIAEGFGDVLAAYTYLEDGDPAYQAANKFCVMEWDATGTLANNAPLRCERRVDGISESTGADIGQYDGTPNEAHDDGRYWSAMVTCVYNGIEPAIGAGQARLRILELVLAHTTQLVPTTENGAFADSVSALRVEDNARFNGDEVALINDCARSRLGFAATRDSSPPEVTGRLSPAAPDGANGWYRTAPAVSWDVTDRESQVTLSGCQQGTDPADTAQKTVSCTASSRGGVTARTVSYRKDGRPPSLAPALSLATPRVGQHLTVVPKAADAVSGVVSQSCATPSTATRGPKTVTCTATDAAGNQATQAVSYTVDPRQTFAARTPKVAAAGTLSFRLRSNAGGRVLITAAAGGVRFRSSTTALTAGRSTRIALRPVKADRKALKRKLRSGRRVKVRVTITPSLGGGKSRLTLKVRR